MQVYRISRRRCGCGGGGEGVSRLDSPRSHRIQSSCRERMTTPFSCIIRRISSTTYTVCALRLTSTAEPLPTSSLRSSALRRSSPTCSRPRPIMSWGRR